MDLTLQPGNLDLATLRSLRGAAVRLSLANGCRGAIEASRRCIADIVSRNEVVYGVNTGFGMLANTRIEAADIQELQRKIVLSHSAGVGGDLDERLVRLILILKINSLARGYSGVRPELIDALIQLLNSDVYPCIPEKGSVGASGDLAPLAHVSAVLIGEGRAQHRGRILSAREALKIANLEPLTLEAKEGLALINGTQVSTALALEGLFLAENLFAGALITGSMSIEAALASRKPFDERIHAIRGFPEQIDTAGMFRTLLGERSGISDLHAECDKVQDPYSLRCQPQVMGACLWQIRGAARLLLDEANGVTDNPLVFAEDADVLSGGNFHAQSVAMAADNLALALAETGSIAERRISLLINKDLSQLPPFAVENSGVNSGFMIPHVTAAALVSENKCLAHPSGTDSIPTSANQEDHVSMATYGARRLITMAGNTAVVLGIELMAAAQGMDLRRPARSTPALEAAKRILRQTVPFYSEDRYFSSDMNTAAGLLLDGDYNSFLPEGCLPSIGPSP